MKSRWCAVFVASCSQTTPVSITSWVRFAGRGTESRGGASALLPQALQRPRSDRRDGFAEPSCPLSLIAPSPVGMSGTGSSSGSLRRPAACPPRRRRAAGGRWRPRASGRWSTAWRQKAGTSRSRSARQERRRNPRAAGQLAQRESRLLSGHPEPRPRFTARSSSRLRGAGVARSRTVPWVAGR